MMGWIVRVGDAGAEAEAEAVCAALGIAQSKAGSKEGAMAITGSMYLGEGI